MRVRTAMMSLKTKIIIAVTAVVVVTAAIAAGIFLTKEDAYRVLKVFELVGSATVTRGDTGDLDAYVGMNLESGDKVKVGSDSQMRLSLDGDKYILLDSDSLLELKASGAKKDNRTTLELKKGAILNEITSSLSENSSYEVNTPKATMAVRGTSFSVSVKKDGDRFITDIYVFHGTVAVQLIGEDGKKKGEVVLVTEDNCVTIITEPNKNTENDPTVDGYSYFVKRSADDENSFEKVGEGEDPVYSSIYKYVSETILLRVVSSDSDGTLNISQEVIDRILESEEISTDSESTADENDSDDTDSTSSSDDSDDLDASDDSHETDSQIDALHETNSRGSTSSSETQNNNVNNESKQDSTVSTVSTPDTTSVDQPGQSDNDDTEQPAEDDTPQQPVTKSVVKFVSENGEVLYTYNVETGKTLGSVPEIPAKKGHTGAWIIDGTNKEFTLSTIISSDMTVTAVYTINSYTVTFTAPDADNQNDVPADITADYGTLLKEILPEVPTKTGYSGEWKINGTDEITSSTKVTEDITVTAVYTINSYTVTFTAPDADDPTNVPSDITADYGTLLKEILPEIPAKTGYSGEWKINGTDEITSSTKVTADVTVTAVYTINSYTVTFTAPDADDPTNVPSDITADYGTLLSDVLTEIPEVPEKTGYDGEWLIDGKTAITDSVIIDGDMTITAVYTIKQFTVSYYDTSYTVNTIMADFNSGLLSVLESLKLENVSSDLSDPYVWTTYGYAWGSTLSGQIRADDTMKVTKDIDTSYVVSAYEKEVVTYYYMTDDGEYAEGGKFYVLSGECVADCDPDYISSLLGTEYSEFLDDYGDAFDENTVVYSDMNIYAALADKTNPDSG